MKLLSEYPNIVNFVMRAFYSQNEEISNVANEEMQNAIQNSFTVYFQHLDFHKFKEGVDPLYIYQMLVWMTDGYLHEKQSVNQKIVLHEVMEDYDKWKHLFRRMVYKEEYL